MRLSYFSEMAVRSSKTDMFVYFLLKLRHWVVDYNDNTSSIDGISDENLVFWLFYRENFYQI